MRFLVMDDPTSTWGHGVDGFDAVEGALRWFPRPACLVR